MLIRYFLVLLTIVAFLHSVNATAQTTPSVSETTLGDFLAILKERAASIDTTADSSAKIGNSALAQQQYLLHDIIERSFEQLRVIYEVKLAKPLTSLEVADRDALGKFVSATENISIDDINSSSEEVERVYKAANELFKFEFSDGKHPIIYGMIVGDLLNSPTKPRADLEIIGFNVVDNSLKENPHISIESSSHNNYPIQPGDISVKDDRILVNIPESIQDDIAFGRRPCDPRPTFSVSISVYTTESRGVWPLLWNIETVRNFQLHALPGARNFELYASYNAERPRVSSKMEPFSRKSDSVFAECGQTVSSSVKVDAPAGAREISCAASWVDARAVKSMSQSCRIDGNSIEGRGAITGRDWFCSVPSQCNCSEAASGSLQIEGTYKVQQTAAETMTDVTIGTYTLPAESEVTFPVNLETGANLKHIGILIKRKSCPDAYDHLDLSFQIGSSVIVKATSKNGFFRATYANGRIAVRHSTSESTLGDSDPK